MGPTLTLAMADPTNVFAIDDVKFMTNLNVEPVIASETSIQIAIGKYYGGATQIDIFDAAFAVEAEKMGTPQRQERPREKRRCRRKKVNGCRIRTLSVSLEDIDFEGHDGDEFEVVQDNEEIDLSSSHVPAKTHPSFGWSTCCWSTACVAERPTFTSSRMKRIFALDFVLTAFFTT